MKLAIIDDRTFRIPLIDEHGFISEASKQAGDDAEARAAAAETALAAYRALFDGTAVSVERGDVVDYNAGTDGEPAIAAPGAPPVPIIGNAWIRVRPLSEEDYRRARRAAGAGSRFGEMLLEEVGDPRGVRQALEADLQRLVAAWVKGFEINIEGEAVGVKLTADDHPDDVLEAATRRLASILMPVTRAPGLVSAGLLDMAAGPVRNALQRLAEVRTEDTLDDDEVDAINAHKAQRDRLRDALVRAALVGIDHVGEGGEMVQLGAAEAQRLYDKLTPVTRRSLRDQALAHVGRMSAEGKSLTGPR